MLHPMAALGYFLTHHTLHQIPRHHWQNPTLILLFSTVKDILSKEGNDMIYKASTRYIVDQAKRTLEKSIEENDNGEINSKKKKNRVMQKKDYFQSNNYKKFWKAMTEVKNKVIQQSIYHQRCQIH